MEPNINVPQVDLTEFVKFNILCLQFFGYFSPEFNKGSLKKLLYIFYASVFVGFAFVLNVLTEIFFMIESVGNIEKMTEASYLLFTNFVQCFKLFCFIIYGTRIWKLVHNMNKDIFKPRNIIQYNLLRNKIKMSKLNSKLFLLGCTLTCISWATSPMLDKKDDEGIRLPLSGWYPFKTDKSPAFEVVYVYQIFSTWVCGLADISMDTFMSGAIMFISAQLSVLNNALETMGRSGQPIQAKSNSSTTNLITNVDHHRSILEFSNEVTYLFSTGITAQFVVGGIVVCMSMFQLSLIPVISFQFFALLLYQTCVLIEIYLWCFYGNEIILESDRLTQSAYTCEWVEASAEFKKNLIIFLSRTQFPIKLYASGYFALSLDTFKAIAKSSWSYFAVLNQVHEDKIK